MAGTLVVTGFKELVAAQGARLRSTEEELKTSLQGHTLALQELAAARGELKRAQAQRAALEQLCRAQQGELRALRAGAAGSGGEGAAPGGGEGGAEGVAAGEGRAVEARSAADASGGGGAPENV